MINFRQALLKLAAPRLAPLGYEYDDALRDRNLMYGFKKNLQGDIWALVLFQRHQHEEHAVGHRFTVCLRRYQTKNVKNWGSGGYEGSLFTRLSSVLWFVYHERVYGSSDYWWDADTVEEFSRQIDDVLDKLERYGIPWLEDLQSSDPLEIPPAKREEFDAAMQKQVVPELERLGYTLKVHPGTHTAYFSKQVQGRLHAFIEFRQAYLPEWGRFEFYVALARKYTTDYFDFSRGSQLSISLAELVWHVYGVDPREMPERDHIRRDTDGESAPVLVPPLAAFGWKYADRRELEAQLAGVLRKVKRYAIPWLEDPSSKNPW